MKGEWIRKSKVISMINDEIIATSDFLQHDTQIKILNNVEDLKGSDFKSVEKKIEHRIQSLKKKANGSNREVVLSEIKGLKFAAKLLNDVRVGGASGDKENE